MKNIEGQPHRTNSGIESVFDKYAGLRQTLASWSNPANEDPGPLAFKEVIEILSKDGEARQEALRLLHGQPGYEMEYDRDPEAARAMREELAWALVEKLASGKA
jgi:hypothetical protein